MHIAVLGSTESWYVNDLRRAAANRHVITPVTFRQLGASVHRNSLDVFSGDVRLHESDAVLVRTMPPGSLEQVVFRMDALAQLEARGVPVINPPKAMEVAVDKYLCTCILAQAGIDTPRTFVCQTHQQAVEAFEELGGRAVLKPIFGGEGRGITLLDDAAIAERVFRTLDQLGAVLYLQEFIEHEGCDLRILVVGEQLFGMRRVSRSDWRTNVSRGARAEPLAITDELAARAHRAAAAIGAPLAGVDLLPGRDGRLYALEVNAVPGWRALAMVTNVDVAQKVLELIHSPRGSVSS